MGFFYQKLVRPVLFRMEAEEAHHAAVAAMSWLGALGPWRRPLEAWGLAP